MKYLQKKKILFFLALGALFLPSATTLTNQNTAIGVKANYASGASFYNDPTTYYQGINDDLVGEELMSALSTLTSSGFISKSYASLVNIYQYSDASLTDSTKMVMFYTGTERPFSGGSMAGGSNKEHVWPASWYGIGDRTQAAGSPGADAHNIWPSASDLNSKRGSAAFDELSFSGNYKANEFGSLSYAKTTANESYFWSPRSGNSNNQNTEAVYPPKDYRGQVARTLMYVATRYRNDSRYPVMLHDEPITEKIGRIGRLSTLLKWHYEEPPSAFEIKRNNEIASRWHNNRNPFVDNPHYATRIFDYLPEPDGVAPTAAVKDVIATYAPTQDKIQLDKTNVALALDETIQVNVINNPLEENYTWISDNPSIASINASGLITAHAVGQTIIRAVGTETTATMNVRVYDPTIPAILVSSVTLPTPTLSLQIGETTKPSVTVLPTDASNPKLAWTSSNHSVATVDADTGLITALNVGSATIMVTSTDGSNKGAMLTLTVTPMQSSSGGWNLVTSGETLTSGDQIVITSSANLVSAGSLSGSYLSSVATTFTNDQILEIPPATTVFTLGGSIDNWTLTNPNGQDLGYVSEKTLAYTSGTKTWKIMINSSGEATITSTENASHKLQYNKSAPRFTTYNSQQVLPEIYRFTPEEGEQTPKEEALQYISSFMLITGEECAVNNVLQTTWSSLKNTFRLLSNEAKDYIALLLEDPFVDAFVARYLVIIEVYNYDNFLVNSLGDSVFTMNEIKRDNTYNAKPLLTFFGVMILLTFSAYLLTVLALKKRKI